MLLLLILLLLAAGIIGERGPTHQRTGGPLPRCTLTRGDVLRSCEAWDETGIALWLDRGVFEQWSGRVRGLGVGARLQHIWMKKRVEGEADIGGCVCVRCAGGGSH